MQYTNCISTRTWYADPATAAAFYFLFSLPTVQELLHVI